jgi:hypothetical protein
MAADPNDAHVKVSYANSIVTGYSATTTPRPSTSSRKLSLPTTDGALGYCVALRFYFRAASARGAWTCRLRGSAVGAGGLRIQQAAFLKSTIAAAAVQPRGSKQLLRSPTVGIHR